MKLKDKMIKKLLNVGKKHRILVYPTLALVAVISAISNAVCWGRGNGKKLVASAMVVAMLITQSLFLTSSADVDDPLAGAPAADTPVNTTINVNYYLLDENNTATLKKSEAVNVTGTAETGYTTDDPIAAPAADKLAEIAFGNSARSSNFTFTDPYILDNGVQKTLPQTVTVENLSDSVDVYFSATRTSYPAVITKYNGTDDLSIVISVPVDNQTTGKINPKASYTVKGASDYGAYRWGYTFNGLKYNEGSNIIGSTFDIEPTGYVDVISLEPGWNPMSFTVDYVAVDDGTVSWPSNLTFPSEVSLNPSQTNKKTSSTITYGNDAVTLYNNADIWAGNEAYILTGWYDPVNDMTYSNSTAAANLAIHDGNINDDDANGSNIKGVTLYAVWTYKDIKIDTSGDHISLNPDNPSNVDITGTYGDAINSIITAKYVYDSTDGSRFTYTLGTDGSATVGEAVLAKYGLTGQSVIDENGISTGYKISGTLNNVTEGAAVVTLPLVIADANKPGTSTTHYINIDISKREVSIDPASIKSSTDASSGPYKPYDGTNLIGVANTAEVLADTAELSGKLVGDSVYVTIGNANATLDSVNAGDGKTITLHSVALAGDKAGMYKLKGLTTDGDLEVANVARVSRKALEISIERVDGLDTAVLFGQDTPQYRILIKDASLLAGDAATAGSDENLYVSLTTDAERTQFMTDILGFTGWSTTRKLYSQPGDYTISPVFDYSLSNYTVETTGSSATFTVERKSAVKDTDYKYSTTKASNGFYPGLTITPYGDYDLIRLLGDSDNDIAETMTKSEAVEPFTSQVSIGDCVDKTIRFQLLDSETGSITTIVTDTVSVDNSVPVYVSHTISENVRDKVNCFDFGTYYHAQDGIETVQITFIYNADYSDCSKLYYYFVPDGQTTGGGEISVGMDRIPGTNNYTGTITIGTGNAGQLVVYAMNSTGATSIEKKIRIDSASDYATDTDFYEWMIENNKIAVNDITVTDINGNEIVNNDEWYNGIKFSVPAEDDQSGVWKIEWIIRDEAGNPVTPDSDSTLALKNLAAAFKEYGKVTSYTFKNSLTDSALPAGKYTIAAKLYDNAGNVTEIPEAGPFMVDCNPPDITDTTVPPSGAYQSNVTFKFTVSDGENESGLDTVKLYDMNVSDPEGLLLNSWGVKDEYTQEITANGTYKVVATDKAGNVETYIKVFTGISEQIPDKPIITVTGTIGNNGWYYKDPVTIHIKTTTKTSDNVPVDTGYKITFEDHYSTGVVPKQQADDYQIPVTKDGQVSVEAWAASEAGLTSQTATQIIKVDTSAPVVTIEESSVDEDGIININYRVTDEGSGVDKVTINGEEAEVTITDGIARGTFKVTEDKEYVISAVDVAGNESGDKGFEPLVLKASPVLDITSSSAYIEADVIEGTYVIDDCYIAYKKHTDSTYTTALITKDDTVPYGIHMEAALRKLAPETVYDYRIYAVTKTSREIRTIEGSFKTGSNNSMANIRGTAVYDENLVAEYDRYPIYVSLFDGNTYIAGYKLEGPSDTAYEFNKIADGTYRIVATDGLLTKTKRVVVENSGIVEPANYLSANGVNFVLNGMSTDMVIKDNSVNVVADGLDSIFESAAYYEGVITSEDKQVIAAGGSVNVTLYAEYTSEDALTAEEANLFDRSMAEDEHIQKYISLYIVKYVRDVNGVLVEEPTLVPMLYDDISITFPLGELSGKTVYVASAHKEQSGGYTFRKWTDPGEVTLTERTVTISTNLFSTYALYTKNAPAKTYVVKWIDGDGKLLKTELVEEGKAATPPTGTPTKAATSKYTYTFAGWNTKYDSITKDVIIAATFTANEIKDSTENKAPDASVEPGDNTNSSDKDKPNYSYMGPESPKTGDTTPVVFLAVIMLISVAGIIIIKKLHNEE